MLKRIALLLPVLALFQVLPGQKFTISGYVTDSQSGEKLISARVMEPARKEGALTNAYGFYSLTLDAGTVALNCSYIGFKSFNTAFELSKDTTINIDLMAEGVEVETVEITDERDIVESSQMSTIDVPVEMIKKIPSLMGEVDVIKALQLLPGVQKGSEGSTGFYVRGGGPDQNLILLDGVPVYNVSHLFGFFSVFPADAISNVSLIKGGFPARYGGRLSSVLDISLKDGNLKKWHGEGSVGIIASKLTVEGPIWKDKTSVMLSARRTYLDILAQPIIRAASQGSTAGYYFYDAVAKVNHKFNDRNRLFLSFYGGRDKAYARDQSDDTFGGTRYESEFKTKLGWGNLITALRWNHLFSDKLFANFTGTYSQFQFGVGFDSKDAQTTNNIKVSSRYGFGYESFIKDWSLRTDFDWFASPNHLIRFGAYGTHHNFTPGVTNIVIESPGYNADTSLGAETINAIEMGAYIEDDWKITNRQKLNLGVHGSGFSVNGTFYRSLQPRLSYRLLLSDSWSAKASFTTMYQYIHLLTNANVGLPTDLWVPATDSITPQGSVQGAVGITHTFKDLGLELSVEGYYKYMTGLLEYKEGASYFAENADWQGKVVQGRGWSYGSEFFLQKKYGKTTGWIGYTLSWTNRQFDALNNGNVFPFKYDRRHDMSIVLQHKFTEKIDAAITWVYGTGSAVTLPVGSYNGLVPDYYFGTYQPTIDHVIDRNGYRMRAYHRLDLGINLTKQKKHFERTWSIGVYNAYSRRNPFFLFLDNDPVRNVRVLKQVSLFPIIPSIAYRFKF